MAAVMTLVIAALTGVIVASGAVVASGAAISSSTVATFGSHHELWYPCCGFRSHCRLWRHHGFSSSRRLRGHGFLGSCRHLSRRCSSFWLRQWFLESLRWGLQLCHQVGKDKQA